MKLEQSFDVAAPLERVWSALIDVEHVAPCLPGAAVTGRNDDGTYNGTFTIKIGPTTASYAGKLEMENIDESAHRATMQANGTDKRGQGGAKATIVSSLSELAGGGTRVQVDTDYQITGRLARFGRGGMIEDISERLLREFAARLQESLARDPGPGETGDGAGAATAESSEEPLASSEPAAEAPPSGDEDTEEDRWQTVNVAALRPDAATEGESPASESGEAPASEAGDEAPPTEAGEAVPTEAGEAVPTEATPPPPAAPPPPTAPPPPKAPPPPSALSAPPPPVEPLDAGALVGAVMWERIRRNAVVPLAFVAGLLLALFLFRRRRRS